ncbi:U24-ctenitoxin-Pn1a-like protein [Leptotrombidium deliense]|uniref:U24-ctenitoxin-Pn1a-like protein n=1 Tax=Leptotrombidium deliense TaxID=299467 RepID=A0A443S272_9ACAR|nr:U24-ctenitoxin-Pn1a-like protein [Leptotrombidium deliense]
MVLSITPECEANGEYKAMSCMGDKRGNKYCMCYSKTGKILKNPSKLIKNCNCFRQQFEALRVKNSFIPSCTKNGDYIIVDVHTKIRTGASITPLQAKRPIFAKPYYTPVIITKPNQSKIINVALKIKQFAGRLFRQLCSTDSWFCSDAENTNNKPNDNLNEKSVYGSIDGQIETPKPTATNNREVISTKPSMRCYTDQNDNRFCSCHDNDGKLIKQASSEIIACKCVREQYYATITLNEYPNTYVPQCQKDGTYEPKQCDKAGTCWCVNAEGKQKNSTNVSQLECSLY